MLAHSVKSRFVFLVAVALLLLSSAFAQIPGLAESHIEANVPDAKDFRPFLLRDLGAYLKPRIGEGVTVDYELLRDGPTQTGIAYPKFYLWLTASLSDKPSLDGAACVAAIDKKEFKVVTFITRSDIVAHPEALASVFPQLLLHKLRDKAGLKQ